MIVEWAVVCLQPGLIQYHGYPAETHWVTTEDGYVLGIHRIPGRAASSSRSSSSSSPAVILAHPLLSSSAEWIVAGPGKSLGEQQALHRGVLTTSTFLCVMLFKTLQIRLGYWERYL